MLRSFAHFLILLLLALPTLLRGRENWAQLKLGMTSEETAAALGEPMFRTSGTGFERWTYDDGAEVLIFGSLIGWTEPKAAKLTARSVDLWQMNRTSAYFPTFLALLPRPVMKPGAPLRDPAKGGGTGGETGTAVYVGRQR